MPKDNSPSSIGESVIQCVSILQYGIRENEGELENIGQRVIVQSKKNSRNEIWKKIEENIVINITFLFNFIEPPLSKPHVPQEQEDNIKNLPRYKHDFYVNMGVVNLCDFDKKITSCKANGSYKMFKTNCFDGVFYPYTKRCCHFQVLIRDGVLLELINSVILIN